MRVTKKGSSSKNASLGLHRVIYIPGTQMTSIFEGQPPKTRPFPIKTRVIWVPGTYIPLITCNILDYYILVMGIPVSGKQPRFQIGVSSFVAQMKETAHF